MAAVNENRSHLDALLGSIDGSIVAMIDLVIDGIGKVTTALLEGNVASADAIIVGDDEVDLLSVELEDVCLETLVTQQPVATDLRVIVAALHMNTDIERSADLVGNIAKAVGRLQGVHLPPRVAELIVEMSDQAVILFERARLAYATRDDDLAATIDELDDILDDLHYHFVGAVLNAAGTGEILPEQAVQLAIVGRFYERIGDHAENLGARLQYMITGWRAETTGADRARVTHAPDRRELVRSRGLAVIEAAAEERRIDAIRRDFVANVSHELKTPVGAIALLAETLSTELDPSARERLAGRLTGETDRVERIINDLLELSRLEDPDSFRLEQVPVDQIITEAVDQVHAFATQRRVELSVSGLPISVSMSGDHRQLVRGLANLIDNAVRYSEAGSSVLVTVSELEETVHVAVKDEADGIPRAELERIFERFYRVDRARSRETGGTGLGLAIVKHVADNHHGRVLVESKLGVGSTFTLELPVG
jgi:phosphate transport system regulatory protein PhoU